MGIEDIGEEPKGEMFEYQGTRYYVGWMREVMPPKERGDGAFGMWLNEQPNGGFGWEFLDFKPKDEENYRKVYISAVDPRSTEAVISFVGDGISILDRASAEKIMGWVVSTEPYLEGVYKFKDSDQTARVHWQPSKDIGQAWEVFQKIFKMGAANCSICCFDAEKNRWYAEVRVRDASKPGLHALYVGGVNSAPEAIVRACLKFQEWYDAQPK